MLFGASCLLLFFTMNELTCSLSLSVSLCLGIVVDEQEQGRECEMFNEFRIAFRSLGPLGASSSQDEVQQSRGRSRVSN